ncbi:hypothetical protein [Microcoleus sp. K4-B3]|uniref:hypothetical protein n=1 Tax=Microcoleus sp. K4-B3 TaxID=2818791 RepID=UPI002FD1A85B
MTILNKIVTALERHDEILQNHRNAFAIVHEQLSDLSKRVKELESDSSFDSAEVRGICDIAARLNTIANTPEEKS